MNMTPKQKAQWLDAAQALLDGEPIEFLCSNGVWDDTTSVTNNYPHRRKPKHDPLAEVKAAHAAGRKVEFKSIYDGQWKPLQGNPTWQQYPNEYRIAPWTLPEPPEGQQWHRTDWTEDMLPEGWRPLLLNEFNGVEDEVFPSAGAEGWRGKWQKFTDGGHPDPWRVDGRSYHWRTRRPLPTPPRMVPLTRGDVPPGSVFLSPSGDVFVPVRISDRGVYFMLDNGMESRSWAELVAYGWRILRPGDSEFSKCEKEEAKP